MASATPGPATASHALALLERAIGYTRASLHLVGYDDLGRRTPCRDWDLRALLRHMDDSLLALQEGADAGYVVLCPHRSEPPPADPVASLRLRACALLGAWTNNGGADLVSVAGSPVAAGVLASTGALEIAVHGWDVARACGHDRPLPEPLAVDLLEVAPSLVSDGDRPARFAAAVDVPASAGASARLLALLGRDPR
jgi:uncharacterized protein (TIGR03086 family)